MGRIKADDLGLVNCAACNRVLFGEKTAARLGAHGCRARGRQAVAGRIAERPYCAVCLELNTGDQRAVRREAYAKFEADLAAETDSGNSSTQPE